MSQAGIISTAAGPVPPTVATTYITNNGNAVPAGNVLIITAEQSDDNVDDGITTQGIGNEVIIQLTNRATAQVTTSNATPTTIETFSFSGDPGVCIFNGMISAFNQTDGAGAAYFFTTGARTNGTTATEIGTEFTTEFEEAAMSTADVNVSVSGNDIIFTVTGIAGKTIKWDFIVNFRIVS